MPIAAPVAATVVQSAFSNSATPPKQAKYSEDWATAPCVADRRRGRFATAGRIRRRRRGGNRLIHRDLGCPEHPRKTPSSARRAALAPYAQVLKLRFCSLPQ